ncbi:shikimate dehydrogenase [Lysobacteraceae bacterium NML93-0792]|nr:shikimate dehydrogenase [Xanthomonadaceae bacterium NML93-0792]PBS17439.1 shikimate dehydrogenase [Xanthomonadaceae bacterium NML93-0793]PBS20638.1 shikimate dehydrogenase [Xanthomonadaceae bacterium NML93-0831]
MPHVIRLAVFGHPVAHSLSPRIHAAFGTQSGHTVDYRAIDAAPELFAAALQHFAAEGGTGANVTLPLKEAAYALTNTCSERARRAGAVNTLIREGEAWHGDNTDGTGLVRDLTDRQGLDLRGRRTLLIGAGGAARGVAPALLDAGVHGLTIVNRTASRTDALADALGDPARVHSRYLEQLDEMGEFDLIVNATSAGRAGTVPDLPRSLVGMRTVAVDLSYGEAAVPFLAWARAHGARQTVDGLGMLVEQAAESFALWYGERPETDTVYEALRQREASLVTAD